MHKISMSLLINFCCSNYELTIANYFLNQIICFAILSHLGQTFKDRDRLIFPFFILILSVLLFLTSIAALVFFIIGLVSIKLDYVITYLFDDEIFIFCLISIMYRIRSLSQKKSSEKKSLSAKKVNFHKQQKKVSLKITKNRYLCLQEHSNHQILWSKILQYEMDMSSTVIAFQNNNNMMKIDAKKKLRLRQTFVLKKDIINCITNGNFDNFQKKLEELKQKSVNQSSLVALFIDYYKMRQQILNENFVYNKSMIQHIKNNVLTKIDKKQKQRTNFIFIRILYILALHIIKLEGILLCEEDIRLISKALTHKKKYLSELNEAAFRNNLESLLFTTFEFYKILHRLKSNQDLILQYYNEIKAYLIIFKEDLQGFQQFQKQLQIQQKLVSLVPINLNLNIYQDYQRRRVLSFQQIQHQLKLIHQNSRNIKVYKTKKKISHKDKKEDEGLHTSDSDDISQNNSNIQENSNKTESISKEMERNINKIFVAFFDRLQNRDIIRNNIKFNFIIPNAHTILIGEFKINVNLEATFFNIQIKLSDKQTYRAIYKTSQIPIGEDKKIYSFGKNVWKIIKQNFYTDKSQFMPSLFSFQAPPVQDIPQGAGFSPLLHILIAIHVVVVHYLRKQTIKQKMIGNIIPFPEKTLHYRSSITNQMANQQKIQQQLFSKRLGFISFDRKLHRNNNHKNLVTLFINFAEEIDLFHADFDSKQISQIQRKFIKNKFTSNQNLKIFTKRFKKCEIMWNMKKKFMQKMRQKKYYCGYFAQNQILTNKKIDLKRIIKYLSYHKDKEDDEISNWLNRLHEIFNSKKITYKVEKQFQMIQTDNFLESKYRAIKIHRQKEKRKYVNQSKIQKAILKLKNKLWVCNCITNTKYLEYYQNKNHLIIPKSILSKVQIVYLKFRLYKQFFIKPKDEKSIYQRFYHRFHFNQFQRKNMQFCEKVQSIKLRHKKTCIVKYLSDKLASYFYLNVFLSEELQETIIVQLYNFRNFQRLYAMIPTSSPLYSCLKQNQDVKWSIKKIIDTKKQVPDREQKVQFINLIKNSIDDLTKRITCTDWRLNDQLTLYKMEGLWQKKLICDAQSFYQTKIIQR